MSAVLRQSPRRRAGRRRASEGVWARRLAALARRPRRHGLAGRSSSLFLLLIAAAGDRPGGQRLADARSACRTRRPTFVGPRRRDGDRRDRRRRAGPNVDISAVDPLAPRYKEWAERAAKYKTVETPSAETLPFGGDRLGRDVLAKAIKGTQISVFVGVLGGARRHR